MNHTIPSSSEADNSTTDALEQQTPVALGIFGMLVPGVVGKVASSMLGKKWEGYTTTTDSKGHKLSKWGSKNAKSLPLSGPKSSTTPQNDEVLIGESINHSVQGGVGDAKILSAVRKRVERISRFPIADEAGYIYNVSGRRGGPTGVALKLVSPNEDFPIRELGIPKKIYEILLERALISNLKNRYRICSYPREYTKEYYLLTSSEYIALQDLFFQTPLTVEERAEYNRIQMHGIITEKNGSTHTATINGATWVGFEGFYEKNAHSSKAITRHHIEGIIITSDELREALYNADGKWRERNIIKGVLKLGADQPALDIYNVRALRRLRFHKIRGGESTKKL